MEETRCMLVTMSLQLQLPVFETIRSGEVFILLKMAMRPLNPHGRERSSTVEQLLGGVLILSRSQNLQRRTPAYSFSRLVLPELLEIAVTKHRDHSDHILSRTRQGFRNVSF